MDEELLGTWDDGRSTEMSVVQPAKASIGAPKGMMELYVVERPQLLFFVTRFGDSRYINFVNLTGEAGREYGDGTWRWNTTDVESYYIMKYTVSEFRWVWYDCDQELLARKAGTRIAHTTSTSTVAITDSTANVHRFVKDHGDSLFTPDSYCARVDGSLHSGLLLFVVGAAVAIPLTLILRRLGWKINRLANQKQA
jgi:hypothetical protein